MPAAVVSALLVLAYAATAALLGRWYVSAPLAFVAAGSLLGFAGDAPTGEEVVWVKDLADGALALVLFHDAAQVRPRELRSISRLVGRMLLVGFPLIVLAHYLTARLLLPGQPVMLTLFVAAALSPTDAGLGAATLLNRAIPVRVRALLNVESGLNDGLATPVALFAIASLAGSISPQPGPSAARALLDIAVGCAVGAAWGSAGALVLDWSRRHRASTRSARAMGSLTLPILAFGTADLVHGNGFVAAFVAGISCTAAVRPRSEEHVFDLTEATSELLGFAVWLVFGLVAVPQLWDSTGWREILFALLSLTVLRMVPVALCLVRSGLRPATVLFLGWSGPRGLATVVFALLAIESLQMDTAVRGALVAVCLTVLLSVIAHGFTADPLAIIYGAWVERAQPEVESETAPEPQPRGTLARRPRR